VLWSVAYPPRPVHRRWIKSSSERISRSGDPAATCSPKTFALEPEAQRGAHRNILVLCLLLVGVSACLHTDTQGKVCLPFLRRWPIPDTCVMKKVIHADCPGCGMTRSFIAMGHLRLFEALRCHRIGPFLFLYVLAQVPYRLLAMRAVSRQGRFREPTALRLYALALVIALFANWMLNAVREFSTR